MERKGDDRLCKFSESSETSVESENPLLTHQIYTFSAPDQLKNLINEAEENNYPYCELRKTLRSSLKQFEKCSQVADQLVTQKIRSKYEIVYKLFSGY